MFDPGQKLSPVSLIPNVFLLPHPSILASRSTMIGFFQLPGTISYYADSLIVAYFEAKGVEGKASAARALFARTGPIVSRES